MWEGPGMSGKDGRLNVEDAARLVVSHGFQHVGIGSELAQPGAEFSAQEHVRLDDQHDGPFRGHGSRLPARAARGLRPACDAPATTANRPGGRSRIE